MDHERISMAARGVFISMLRIGWVPRMSVQSLPSMTKDELRVPISP
jgi:hypothetical protein